MPALPARKSPAILFILTATFLLAGTTGVSAEQNGLNYLSIVTENDNYAPERQDRHYTNGIRFAFGLAGDDSPWYRWLSGFSGLGNASRQYEIALGQNIYTPENFTRSAPIPDDRPFAGWLHAELSLTSRAPGVEEALAINLGIVGPAALGEETQKFIHDLIDDPKPRGWDNQLRNEPALLLRYRRSWFTPLFNTAGISADLVSRFGTSLGNVVTEAGIGAAVRLGNYLPGTDIPRRIQPGLSGSGGYIPVRRGRTDWMIYAGLQGRGVAYNIFLDGNLYRDSLSVDRKPLVYDAELGMTLGIGRFPNPVFFAFGLIWRGKEFDGQQSSDNFASATLGMHF